jgi:protein-disulfide isomerase
MDTTPPASETNASKRDSLTVPLAIIMAGALIAGAIIYSNNSTPNTAAPSAPVAPEETQVNAPKDVVSVKSDDHVLGNKNAELLIIEYSDMECPFCQRFHASMKQVMANEGKDGSIAWVYRHFPLDTIHPNARKQAEGAECVAELGGNDAFWKYADGIFAELQAGKRVGTGDALVAVATKAGVDRARFSACLESGKYAARVERDFQEGVKIGARGTPHSIIVNQKTGKQVLVPGALPYEQLKSLIAQAQAK